MESSHPSKNAVNWFEIAVTDLDRATRFYESTLDIALKRENFFGQPMAVFPAAQPAAGGALVLDPKLRPGGNNTLIYLDATGKLDASLERAQRAGGAIVVPRTAIGQFGAFAVVRDTEDNLVGLHSAA